MAITIENPTAEEIYEALKQVPEREMERLRAMLSGSVAEQREEESAWHQASRTSATRFFEDEESQ